MAWIGNKKGSCNWKWPPYNSPFSIGEEVCDYHGEIYQAVDGVYWFVDAIGEDGSFGRLINHSKIHRNSIYIPYNIKYMVNLRLFCLWLRDILAGEELWYAYGDWDKEVPDWMKS